MTDEKQLPESFRRPQRYNAAAVTSVIVKPQSVVGMETVEQFLARGGKINVIPTGVCAVDAMDPRKRLTRDQKAKVPKTVEVVGDAEESAEED